MILYRGELRDDRELPVLLKALEKDCLAALEAEPITAEMVVAACDSLARDMAEGQFDHLLRPFLEAFQIPQSQLDAALSLFSRESLTRKLRMELGADPAEEDLPHPSFSPIRRERYPLGILLHIAAGNVDGLPAYSVVEGLLAGNINLLKLPSMDHGASILLLHQLVRREPRLRDYVYVFDVPSTDLATLGVLAEIADGIVVWGGDAAVTAARQLAAPNTRLITWGHKLSFAYATAAATDGDLAVLARHICLTRQLLCSSCQGIFLDTEDMAAVEALGERFFALLREENRRHLPADLSLRAKAALHLRTEELEAHESGRRVFRGDGVSVTVAPDSRLELSWLGGNCWVKPLPRRKLLAALKGQKWYLQTAGLLCAQEERQELSALLARAGLVRITEAGEMSRTLPGEAHDGDYPLRAYSRIVEMA